MLFEIVYRRYIAFKPMLAHGSFVFDVAGLGEIGKKSGKRGGMGKKREGTEGT